MRVLRTIANATWGEAPRVWQCVYFLGVIAPNFLASPVVAQAKKVFGEFDFQGFSFATTLLMTGAISAGLVIYKLARRNIEFEDRLAPRFRIEFVHDDELFFGDSPWGPNPAKPAIAKLRVLRVRPVPIKGARVLKCSPWLVSVERIVNGKRVSVGFRDSVPLPWAAQPDEAAAFLPLDLPPANVKKFVDVFGVISNQNKVNIQTNVDLRLHEGLFSQHGEYEGTIVITSENCPDQSAKVQFSWGGTMDTFVARPSEQGAS